MIGRSTSSGRLPARSIACRLIGQQNGSNPSGARGGTTRGMALARILAHIRPVASVILASLPYFAVAAALANPGVVDRGRHPVYARRGPGDPFSRFFGFPLGTPFPIFLDSSERRRST